MSLRIVSSVDYALLFYFAAFANLTDDLDIGLPSGKSTGKHQPRNHQQPSHTPPQYSFQTSTTTQNNGGSDNQVAQAADDDDDDDDDPFKMF